MNEELKEYGLWIKEGKYCCEHHCNKLGTKIDWLTLNTARLMCAKHWKWYQ